MALTVPSGRDGAAAFAKAAALVCLGLWLLFVLLAVVGGILLLARAAGQRWLRRTPGRGPSPAPAPAETDPTLEDRIRGFADAVVRGDFGSAERAARGALARAPAPLQPGGPARE